MKTSRVNSITIPAQYIKLCEQWHSGQSSTMYAISSTGNLTLGDIKPWNQDEDRAMTDDEHYLYLWQCLDSEVHAARKIAKKFSDAAKLTKFQVYVDSIIQQLSE